MVWPPGSWPVRWPGDAQDGPPPPPPIEAHDVVGFGPPTMTPFTARRAYSDDERQAWLGECRRRHSGSGVGGAIIGGVIGGVAGNRIAGHGNRAVGTVAGTAVGAVAGAAIDKSQASEQARDDCEDYLDRYEASYSAPYASAYGAYPAPGGPPGYPPPGPLPYGYGYAPMIWVPVWLPGCCDCKPKTREVVTEEWVEERPTHRVIPKPQRHRGKIQKIQPATTKSKLVPAK